MLMYGFVHTNMSHGKIEKLHTLDSIGKKMKAHQSAVMHRNSERYGFCAPPLTLTKNGQD